MNYVQWNSTTMKPVWIGHLPKADKRFCPKISVYWSKSHKPNLSKADTCLKRTKILVFKESSLDRFHCIVNLFENYWHICTFFIKLDFSSLWRDLNITYLATFIQITVSQSKKLQITNTNKLWDSAKMIQQLNKF